MTEERWIAIDERLLKDKQKQTFMFMNLTSLDDKAKSYFEYMCDQVMASKVMGGFMSGLMVFLRRWLR
jgi:hypothetical protein